MDFISRIQEVKTHFQEAQAHIDLALPILNQLLIDAESLEPGDIGKDSHNEPIEIETQSLGYANDDSTNPRLECPYPDCNRTSKTQFKERKNLIRHYTSHIIFDERCKICQKTFSDGNEYISHLTKCTRELEHSGTTPFKEAKQKAIERRKELLREAGTYVKKCGGRPRPRKRAKYNPPSQRSSIDRSAISPVPKAIARELPPSRVDHAAVSSNYRHSSYHQQVSEQLMSNGVASTSSQLTTGFENHLPPLGTSVLRSGAVEYTLDLDDVYDQPCWNTIDATGRNLRQSLSTQSSFPPEFGYGQFGSDLPAQANHVGSSIVARANACNDSIS